MGGIVHSTVGTAADDPAAEINKAEWNAAHSVVEYFDITGGAGVPATPAAGTVRPFCKITGTTPNRSVVFGLLLEDGQQVILADVTI